MLCESDEFSKSNFSLVLALVLLIIGSWTPDYLKTLFGDGHVHKDSAN
jgi:hypothetical protein